MAEQKNVQEQDINQLRKVRRERFADKWKRSIPDYKI